MHCLKWKRYNDFIEVSSEGDVKSHGKIIKGEITNAGYKRVHVSHKGKSYKLSVHRVIAEVFIPNPGNLPIVNHKDGNKLNNEVDNLEWCTYGDNLKHAYAHNLRDCAGENNTQSKLSRTDVLEIRRCYVKGKHGDYNSRGLAKKYGVSPRTILDIVKNKTWCDYTEKLFEGDD